jgi:hypothetical protein
MTIPDRDGRLIRGPRPQARLALPFGPPQTPCPALLPPEGPSRPMQRDPSYDLTCGSGADHDADCIRMRVQLARRTATHALAKSPLRQHEMMQNRQFCASCPSTGPARSVPRTAAVRAKSGRPLLTEREATVNGDPWPYDPHSRRRAPWAVGHLNIQRRPLGLDG